MCCFFVFLLYFFCNVNDVNCVVFWSKIIIISIILFFLFHSEHEIFDIETCINVPEEAFGLFGFPLGVKLKFKQLIANHVISPTTSETTATQDLTNMCIDNSQNFKYDLVPDLMELFTSNSDLKVYLDKYGTNVVKNLVEMSTAAADRIEIVRIVCEDIRLNLRNSEKDELKPSGVHLANAASAIIKTFPYFKECFSGTQENPSKPEEAFYYVDKDKNYKPGGFLYRKFENWRRPKTNQPTKRDLEEPSSSQKPKRQKASSCNTQEAKKVDFLQLPAPVSFKKHCKAPLKLNKHLKCFFAPILHPFLSLYSTDLSVKSKYFALQHFFFFFY